jgi:hypothetical protein
MGRQAGREAACHGMLADAAGRGCRETNALQLHCQCSMQRHGYSPCVLLCSVHYCMLPHM